MVKLPVSSVSFGADANETETLYIEAKREPSYTINVIEGGSAAIYSLRQYGSGWLFQINPTEWQSESKTPDIEDLIFDDGNGTATLRVTTNMSPYGSMTFDTQYIVLAPRTETNRVYFTVFGLNGPPVVHFDSSAIKSVNLAMTEFTKGGLGKGYIDITCNDNTGSFISGIVWLTGTDTDGHQLRRDYQFFQPSKKVFPCWRETVYETATDTGLVEYAIVDTDRHKTIYKARAVTLLETLKIDVSKIVSPLLYSTFDFEACCGFVKDRTATLNFALYINGEAVQYYMAYDNYSYDRAYYDGMSRLLNDPIQKRYAKGQPYFFTALNLGNDKLRLDDTEDYALEEGITHFGECNGGDVISAKIGNSELSYKAEQWCGRYIIYYINAYGGLDWLLTEGYEEMTDTMADSTITHPYSNISTEFGKAQYLRTISRKIKLHTGWMTNEESGRMHHLLESARVWLYDMENGSASPVLIADTSMTYKTFENQGRQLVSYDINLEFSQSRMRR